MGQISVTSFINVPSVVFKNNFLYSLPLQKLKSLFDVSKSTLLPHSNSPKYRVISIILDVAHHGLYKPVLTFHPWQKYRCYYKNCDL